LSRPETTELFIRVQYALRPRLKKTEQRVFARCRILSLFLNNAIRMYMSEKVYRSILKQANFADIFRE